MITNPQPLHELALFAGAGGGILGGHLLGWKTVCAVEIDEYARRILMARQDDGCLPAFPVWDDVRTFDGRPWHGLVDVITGGFPCQDISVSGLGEGLDGERSGLWCEMRRIVGEVGPRYVFVENSPALTYRGLCRVLADLAAMGYDARWGVLGAIDAGAPHKRERIWVMAYTHHTGCLQQRWPLPTPAQDGASQRRDWWSAEPGMGRVADGMAYRLDRLHRLGNGQVPEVVRLAWHTLSLMKP